INKVHGPCVGVAKVGSTGIDCRTELRFGSKTIDDMRCVVTVWNSSPSSTTIRRILPLNGARSIARVRSQADSRNAISTKCIHCGSNVEAGSSDTCAERVICSIRVSLSIWLACPYYNSVRSCYQRRITNYYCIHVLTGSCRYRYHSAGIVKWRLGYTIERPVYLQTSNVINTSIANSHFYRNCSCTEIARRAENAHHSSIIVVGRHRFECTDGWVGRSRNIIDICWY